MRTHAQSSTTRRIRRAAIGGPLLLAVLLVGCGDDGDDAAGDDAAGNDEFCELLEDFNDDFGDSDDNGAEFVEALEELSDSAPAELEDPLELFIEFNEALLEAGDDQEAQFDVLGDRRFEDLDDALADLAEFGEDECGIDIEQAGAAGSTTTEQETTTTTEADATTTTTEGDGGGSATGGPPTELTAFFDGSASVAITAGDEPPVTFEASLASGRSNDWDPEDGDLELRFETRDDQVLIVSASRQPDMAPGIIDAFIRVEPRSGDGFENAYIDPFHSLCTVELLTFDSAGVSGRFRCGALENFADSAKSIEVSGTFEAEF